jgi:hypothetical protein
MIHILILFFCEYCLFSLEWLWLRLHIYFFGFLLHSGMLLFLKFFFNSKRGIGLFDAGSRSLYGVYVDC